MTGRFEPELDVADGVELFAVSPQQRHLWALGGLSASTPFRVAIRATLRGPVDLGKLHRGFARLVERHEVFRTRFATVDDVELAQSLDGMAPALAFHDLTTLDEAAQLAALAELESGASRRPLEFLCGPLWSAMLIRLGERLHTLLLHAPALCCDGPGLINLVAELVRNHGAAEHGADVEDIPPVQYVDASLWLNDALVSVEAAVAREYWSRVDALAATAAPLPFALRPPRAAAFQPDCTAAWRMRRAEDSSGADLDASAQTEALLLACWRELLRRYAASVVHVASASDGRSFEELQSGAGLFHKCLPLPISDTAESSVAAVLADNARVLAEARQWAEAFDWQRTVALQPLPPAERYPAVVHEHREWPTRISVGELDIAVDVSAYTERCDLKLVSHPSGSDVVCWLEFDAARYRRADIERLSRQLQVLVDDARNRPTARLEELDVLDGDDARDVLELINRAKVSVADQCVHERFEARVRERPDTTAVVCEGSALTYDQLNRAANRLARCLQRLGIGPDARVAICLERSTDLIVCLMAALKAGGAYVPIEPHAPATRRTELLADSGAVVAITRGSTYVGPDTSIPVIDLDRDAGAIAAEADHDLGVLVRPSHLAYVLFTSGSTGRPKGVAIEHRHVVSYTRAVCDRLELPANASCASVTTLASDLGNTAVFPALLEGGTLHVVTEQRASDPQALGDYFARWNIDLLKIVPSHLSALLAIPDAARVLPRKRLVCGGEALSWDLVERVRQLAPGCRVFNHYGPTETTVGAAVFEVTDICDRGVSTTVPIGWPLPHARAYVVDSRRRLLPVWMPGELLIGGSAVARGYLNAPELTEQRFVLDPFCTDPANRVYRTGDLVRALPDGALEFLGRTDDQVKIRGYRVEPGEVTAAIRRHPEVRDAIVLVREQAGEKRLAAFVVMRGNGDRIQSAADLQGFMMRELAPHLVPSSLMVVESLPLTANGKVDRAALLNLRADEAPLRTMAASNELSPWESLVAEVWRGLLGIEEISPQDNFYDLGGHSLLAIQVVAAIEARTGLKISPRELTFHTLRQFAASCASRLPLPPQ